jgi:hypothetical protein
MRRTTALLSVAPALLLLQANAQQLPYNPTTVFLSPNDCDVAYILQPPSSTNANGELLSLNISSTLQASNLSSNTITSTLPFLGANDGVNTISYVPAISSSASIAVYAGSCNSSSSLWVYKPGNASNTAIQAQEAGTWTKMATSESPALGTVDLPNANFLASSFYFSTVVDTDHMNASIYAFGGMCPTSANNNASMWQSAAIYSNKMLKLTPSESVNTSYEISYSASTGLRPVPEAGFTITGLVPAYSNSSTGVVMQARTYVLIGGHTETAFIGMDQVALFSLPQESWTFQAVSSQTIVGGSKSAVVSSTTSNMPDSRSGHTALLSSDGTKIIVFGGWVGDVHTPAEPQLVILKLGSGFGGVGDWAWEIPTVSGTGLDAGQGIYGHGAVMLPGDVMMFVGGYEISSAVGQRKRANTSLQTLFLNTTSMAWVADYTNPAFSKPAASGSSGSMPSTGSDNAKKVGIGAGVGIGVAAIIGAIIIYLWYSRKLNIRQVKARERDLQALSQNAHRDIRDSFYGPTNNGEMVQRNWSHNLGNRSMSARYGNTDPAYGPLPYTGYDHEDDTSVSYVVPTSRNNMTIPRKPPNPRTTRGLYQPTPTSVNQYSGFDFGTSHSRTNTMGTAGTIHPIYEADEDNDVADSNLLDMEHTVEYPSASSEDHSDPFSDPPHARGSRLQPYTLEHPGSTHFGDRNMPSPDSPAKEPEHEIKEWIADWAAADALLTSNSRTQSLTQAGRASPGKESQSNSGSGRTESNLSERSAVTLSRSENPDTRSNSLTAFFTGGVGWNLFSSNGGPSSLGNASRQAEFVQGTHVSNSCRATAEGYYTNNSVSPTSDHFGGTLTVPPRSAGSGSNSSAGHSGGSASFITAKTSSSFPALRAEAETLLSSPRGWESGSPSKSKGLKRKPQGWLGSLKRVFGQEEWVGSPGVEREGQRERYVDSPSPTRRDFGEGRYRDRDGEGRGEVEPRRRASDGAALWRRKQGRGDWEDSLDEVGVLQRSYTAAGRAERVRVGADDEEWDVEKAVRGRTVQVMFTVPKETLRVVNQDVVREEEEDDDGDIGMQREESRSPVRDLLVWRDEVGVEERDIGEGKGKERERSRSERSLSPTKSLRSLMSGRVQELVKELEKRENV